MAELKSITINIKRKLMHLHANRRRIRAVPMLREEVARLTKTDISTIRIGTDVNTFFGRNARGASSILGGIKVELVRADGIMTVKLPTSGAVTTLTKAKAEAKGKEEKPKEQSAEKKEKIVKKQEVKSETKEENKQQKQT
jgi:ribosomal protein L31E